MPVQVALTGGTGFIGACLLKTLTDAGIRVKSLTRKPLQNTPQITWVRGDLNQPDSLQALCKDCSVIIHCAGRVRGNNPDDFLHSNLHGTRNLVNAAQSHPTPSRFLFISSLAARQPDYSWYAQSKYQAEQYLQAAALAPPVTIFRPSAVYGPGDKEMQPLFKGMKRGWLVAPAAVHSRLSLLHITDLAAAVMLWLQNDAVSGLYELDDGTDNGYGWDDLLRIGEQVWRRRIRKLPVPVGLLRGAARINLYMARLLRYPAMLTPGKINEITHPDWVCDNDKLTKQTGWVPQIRLADAIDAATVAQPTLQ
ncbi:MAG: NAD-dependent epimerase/dehydratase family protein [Gammaproteobacteria bacterium]